MRLEPVIVGLMFAFASTAATNPSAVTFTKDVTPVLQRNCQGCHRPGEATPFSLLTYEQARPWSKAMREAVLLKKMPPWFADPHFGTFSNDSSLQKKEMDSITSWVDAGAPLFGRQFARDRLDPELWEGLSQCARHMLGGRNEAAKDDRVHTFGDQWLEHLSVLALQQYCIIGSYAGDHVYWSGHFSDLVKLYTAHGTA
jgi:hypothetical protein